MDSNNIGRETRELSHMVTLAEREFGLTAVVEALATLAAQRAESLYERTPGHTDGHAWARVAGRFADLAVYLRPFHLFTK